MSSKNRSITAQNQFTDLVGTVVPSNDIGVDIKGTFVATVTVQFKHPGQAAWQDLATYTAPASFNIIPVSELMYRVGVKTGDFTSGTVDAFITV